MDATLRADRDGLHLDRDVSALSETELGEFVVGLYYDKALFFEGIKLAHLAEAAGCPMALVWAAIRRRWNDNTGHRGPKPTGERTEGYLLCPRCNQRRSPEQWRITLGICTTCRYREVKNGAPRIPPGRRDQRRRRQKNERGGLDLGG